MRNFHAWFMTLLLATSGFAQQVPENDTVNRLSSSAQQELAKGIEELTLLRERIAGEKLPLAQELTAAEETLSRLRREHDQLVRSLDDGNLSVVAVKADTKARQDEELYIANLLGEYAGGFESRVNVSELQYCGEALANAKKAAENTAISSVERFESQAALVELSLKRLLDCVGGMSFPGVAVDLQGTLTNGTFALIGPIALFGAKGGVAGLVIPQSGSANPLVRPLEGALQAGIVALVDTGEGSIPLDPSLGGALKALVQKTSLAHVFEKGGPIMWPLLFASILALGTVIERLIFLASEKLKRDAKALDGFFTAVGRGDTEGALAICKASKFYVLRALGHAFVHKETSLASAMMAAEAQELKRYRRGIPVLDTVITLAPLLGLLGTVVGMMGSFSLIGGDLGAPGAITGGIAEALIATAFGLGIAITALLPFNFLNARMDEARHELQSAATQLELMMQAPPRAPQGSPPLPVAVLTPMSPGAKQVLVNS